MKKKLGIIAGILVALAILILLIAVQPSPSPQVAMGFYGFTSSGARTEALFGISNHPNLSMVLFSVTRPGTNAPKPDDEALGTWTWNRWEPWGITSAVSVTTTNDPLCVVFEFQERAAGLRRIPERGKELWGQITGREQAFFSGRKFLVTNETRFVNATR